MLTQVLGRLAAGGDLAESDVQTVFESILSGSCPEGQVGFLLTALAEKGETDLELATAARLLRSHMRPIKSTRSGIIDTCGTGGDGRATFNISTASAIVLAAAGAPVAKHGNRRVTSATGSADVLASLGVNVDASLDCVQRCLDKLGICFCFAPLWHPAMAAVAAVRRKLGIPTIFNQLGPLLNPAGVEYQLIGVGRPELRPRIAGALARLGVRRAAVVHGRDGLDEVSPSAPSDVSLVEGNTVTQFVWNPEDFGLEPKSLEAIQVASPQASAELIRQVLAGQKGPARNAVLMNAGAALWIAGRAKEPAQCAQAAAAAIDSGAAAALLDRLVRMSLC